LGDNKTGIAYQDKSQRAEAMLFTNGYMLTVGQQQGTAAAINCLALPFMM
jgi:hypothetical protein